MRPLLRLFLAAVLLAGCSFSLGGGGVQRIEGPFPGSPGPGDPLVQKDRIATVATVEIGQGYRGVIVNATGTAPGGGYHAPELRLMNGGQPSADGMIELEFVARPPEPDAPAPTNTGSMRMIAAQFIAADILGAARGVRVHAVGGATERLLGPPPETTPAQEPAG